MTAPNARPAAPGMSVVIRPSLLVRATMGPMTRVLNPAITRLAGRRDVRFAAQIRHVGRRSGREYITPAGARLAGEMFVIPLTFGNQSDWSRNVRAAGRCSIRLNGTDYRAVRPELADGEQARDVVRAAFSPVERAMFRLLGIRQYLLLQRDAVRQLTPIPRPWSGSAGKAAIRRRRSPRRGRHRRAASDSASRSSMIFCIVVLAPAARFRAGPSAGK